MASSRSCAIDALPLRATPSFVFGATPWIAKISRRTNWVRGAWLAPCAMSPRSTAARGRPVGADDFFVFGSDFAAEDDPETLPLSLDADADVAEAVFVAVGFVDEDAFAVDAGCVGDVPAAAMRFICCAKLSAALMWCSVDW